MSTAFGLTILKFTKYLDLVKLNFSIERVNFILYEDNAMTTTDLPLVGMSNLQTSLSQTTP